MEERLKTARRVLIIGDSGRGKTTFAGKLAQKMNLPLYSTDDFFWKTKFTEPSDRQESIKRISEVFSSESWIVEGSTLHLITPGFDRADLIIELVFASIFAQWWSLIKRNRGRDNENILDHLLYVTKKRFGIGNDKEKRKRIALEPYRSKTLRISSYGQMDKLLNIY